MNNVFRKTSREPQKPKSTQENCIRLLNRFTHELYTVYTQLAYE